MTKRPIIPYRLQQAREAEEVERLIVASKIEEGLTEAFLAAHIRTKSGAVKTNYIHRARPPKAIVDYYTNVEAKRAGITSEQIRSRSHVHKISHARFRVWRTLRQNYGYSLPAIGRAFDRDHTTILNGLRKLEKMAA